MVIARASAAPRTLGRVALRRAGAQSRPQAWKQIGRRNYASQGGSAKSSELPWIIGSVGVTVPAAVWLMGQAPKKSDHGHHEEHEEHEEKDESQDEDKAEESSEDDKEEKSEDDKEEKSEDDKKDGDDEKADADNDAEKKDESKDDKPESDDSKDESAEDSSDKASSDDGEKGDDKSKGKSQASSSGEPERKYSDDGYELPGPNAPGQINYKPESGKGPGEGQKGPRPEPELKGDKMSKSDHSGAQNPYLEKNIAEKSKKGEGVADTAKIHGTVDPRRPARGAEDD